MSFALFSVKYAYLQLTLPVLYLLLPFQSHTSSAYTNTIITTFSTPLSTTHIFYLLPRFQPRISSAYQSTVLSYFARLKIDAQDNFEGYNLLILLDALIDSLALDT